MGISSLTEIQQLTVPAIMSGQSIQLSAATGTGKSLAYLLPLLHRMKNEETEHHIVSRRRRPRVLVLVPTRELALQVCSVAKRLCHTAKFRVVAVVGGTQQGQQRRVLDSDVDVIVATPGRLAMLLDQSWLSLADVTALAIDEVDTMVIDNDGFGEELRIVLQRLGLTENQASTRASSSSSSYGARLRSSNYDGEVAQQRAVQVVLAGATIPHRAQSRIRALFPNVKPLASRSAHRSPPGLTHRFVRVAGDPEAKHHALMRFVREFAPTAHSSSGGGGEDSDAESAGATPRSEATSSTAAGGRLLVFCNTIPSARSTAFTLAEAGYNAASLHGGIPPMLRALEFDAFKRGKAPILVCTDAAARGLDISDLDTVLLFDFPLAPVEYLHRAGRVARAGRKGTVISLVAKGDVILARRIQEAVDTGAALTELSGALASSSGEGAAPWRRSAAAGGSQSAWSGQAAGRGRRSSIAAGTGASRGAWGPSTSRPRASTSYLARRQEQPSGEEGGRSLSGRGGSSSFRSRDSGGYERSRSGGSFSGEGGRSHSVRRSSSRNL